MLPTQFIFSNPVISDLVVAAFLIAVYSVALVFIGGMERKK